MMYRIERSVFVEGKMILAGSIVELDSKNAKILELSGVAVEVEATKEVEIKPKKTTRRKAK